ncbi:hypothetical protein C8R43DRAFT_906869, partial [Mycena crocata]
GFMYYHIPYPRHFLSGGIRFRCCENPRKHPGSFARGHDLVGWDGLPWALTLPRLVNSSRFDTCLHRLLEDRLITEEQITFAMKLRRETATSDNMPVTLIHDMGQPFYMDFSIRTRIFVVGPHFLLRAVIYPAVAHRGQWVTSQIC